MELGTTPGPPDGRQIAEDARVRTILITLAGLAACTEQPQHATGSYIESHIESYDFPGSIPAQVDLLFVVDDTAAMTPYTAHVASLAADLEETLQAAYDGALPDMRIAVMTADPTATAYRQPAGTSDPYLAFGVDAHFEPTSNVAGTIAETLAPMLDVGTAGAGPVAPLDAVNAALDAQPAFLRPDSGLGIITIASSDDTSAGAIADYVSTMKARRSDPTRVIVTGAFPQPSPRLDEFHASFPNRNEVVDIASSDWNDVLAIYGQLVRWTLGVACITEPADLDAETPGPQYDCSIGAYYADNTSEPLPLCSDGGPARCWALVEDPQNCFEDSRRFEVRGFPGHYRPTIRGQCVVEGP
jgi:hypothetical protein